MTKDVDEQPSDGPRRGPRSGRVWWSLLLVFVVASAAATLLPLVHSLRPSGTPVGGPSASTLVVHASRGAAPGAGARAVVCPAPPPGASDDGYCARIGLDGIRRAVLTAAQSDGAARLAPIIDSAVNGTRSRRTQCDPDSRACALILGPADAGKVRRALTAAGFPDAIVRTARPDDPAPTGAVLYAVAARRACLLGFQPTGDAAGPGWTQIAGRLPDDTCLSS
ncbi:hypothetical protein DMB66_19660 [Actinoplanes sp. ATCC 53533]|uniref:hypothetical protein n=1 Tax=Actinoplanes sp. ATCC 53533 TaxID=1288362 RepID=UPI000F770102|nr:hypothetical protein [Actinoplanes sp. ATCC 53533]RSM64542.1 hypothetical protein DMB66_19660 [Actinoplanes sp. ATCC 53533]